MFREFAFGARGAPVGPEGTPVGPEGTQVGHPATLLAPKANSRNLKSHVS
jgi:hypothetical protein